MSAPNAGRQSPSPSRQTGPQESDIPGWTGKAEQTVTDGHGSDAEQPMENLAAGRRTGSGDVPVHPLEEESRRKLEKGVVGMR
ncbi:hypothetical protein ACO22_03309 [Paracoccidioides brasiliensis]|uniref:Uncharacterized protein n=1 Tax=Paracoccidioides brasiliensis TaxID=121759 RepID=A0A1D2JGI5_PARBR|nr:hypothetical protein ACO22_03309 [Paracoccidioides brasiliensis]